MSAKGKIVARAGGIVVHVHHSRARDAAAPFEESKHPRKDNGEFAPKGGGSKGGAREEPARKPTNRADTPAEAKSKKQTIADLLKNGTTAKQVLEATGWPSVSMPAQAKAAGMKLEKFKENGQTKYRGVPMSEEELSEMRAAQAAARQAKRGNKPPAIRGPRGRDKTTFSLNEFLSDLGGIKPTPDIKAVLSGQNPFIPGFGRLLREDGLSPDRAREAAVEAGYLTDTAAGEARPTESTINDLLEALDAENRGKKQYRQGQEQGRQGPSEEEQAYRRSQALDDTLEELGMNPAEVSGEVRDRVVEIMAKEGVSDPLVAYERAIMEEDERGIGTGKNPSRIDFIPGWDVDDAGPASRQSKAAAGGAPF